MKNFILTILVLVISGATLFGQSGRPASIILRYQKVTEFVFDEETQNYRATDTIEFSGAISVDPKKVFIKGYNQTSDKTLKIIEVQKEEGTNRDMYVCEMNGERFAVALSPDKKYLTQIGINERSIYELKTSNNQNEQIEVITFDKHSNSKEIFVAQTLSVKPIFGSTGSFEEGEKLLKEYISKEIDQYDKLKSGTSYISIIINKEGKVTDVKLLFGKNEELNAAALEIVKNLPDWKPGQQKGKPVNASYNLEVKK